MGERPEDLLISALRTEVELLRAEKEQFYADSNEMLQESLKRHEEKRLKEREEDEAWISRDAEEGPD